MHKVAIILNFEVEVSKLFAANWCGMHSMLLKCLLWLCCFQGNAPWVISFLKEELAKSVFPYLVYVVVLFHNLMGVFCRYLSLDSIV